MLEYRLKTKRPLRHQIGLDNLTVHFVVCAQRYLFFGSASDEVVKGLLCIHWHLLQMESQFTDLTDRVRLDLLEHRETLIFLVQHPGFLRFRWGPYHVHFLLNLVELE